MSANLFTKVNLVKGSNQVVIEASDGLTGTYSVRYPIDAPAEGEVLIWDSTNARFNWGLPGNSVTIASDETYLSVTDDGSGNYTIGISDQSASTFLAAPIAGGNPTFRVIANADLPGDIDAAKVSVGTLPAAQMPAGTETNEFQIGISSANPKIVSTSTTVLAVQQDDGSAADLVVRKITATEMDVLQVTQVEYGDAMLTLNADYTGSTPTEDAGLEIERGTLVNYQLIHQESSLRAAHGAIGSLHILGYKIVRTFTNADLVGGILTWAHGLNSRVFISGIIDASWREIGVSGTSTDANTITFDIGTTITGTWQAVLFI